MRSLSGLPPERRAAATSPSIASGIPANHYDVITSGFE
jgi:hypothetical protein